jgi:hypothetical protein
MSAEIWNGNGNVYNGWPPKLLERGEGMDVILFVFMVAYLLRLYNTYNCISYCGGVGVRKLKMRE